VSDVFDAAKRSQVMSRIRGRGNLSTELRLVAAFREHRIVGWRRHVLMRPRVASVDSRPVSLQQRISVRPDFMFRHQRVVVFVDGCFWHGCPKHFNIPVSNVEFWTKKLTGNVRRDARATTTLQAAGWKVLRVWEHEMAHVEVVIKRVRLLLDSGEESDCQQMPHS